MTEYQMLNRMGISLEKAEALSRETPEKIMSNFNEFEITILHDLSNECIESNILNLDDIYEFITDMAHSDYRMFSLFLFNAGSLHTYAKCVYAVIHFMLNWIP